MSNTDFISLNDEESAAIEGGYSWMIILGATVVLVAKDVVEHYQAFEAGIAAGYHDARA